MASSTNVKIYLTLRPLVDSSGEVGSVSVVDITRVRPRDPKGFVLEVGLNVPVSLVTSSVSLDLTSESTIMDLKAIDDSQ